MDQKKGSNCTECEGVRVRTCLPQQPAAHEIEKTMYHTSHLLKLPCVSHLYSSRYWQRPSMSTVTVHQRYSPHPHFCILPFPHLISLLIATFCTLRSTSFFSLAANRCRNRKRVSCEWPQQHLEPANPTPTCSDACDNHILVTFPPCPNPSLLKTFGVGEGGRTCECGM